MNIKIKNLKNLKNFKNIIKINRKSLKIQKKLKIFIKNNKIFYKFNKKYIDTKLIKSFNLYFQYLQSFKEFLILDSFKNVKELK